MLSSQAARIFIIYTPKASAQLEQLSLILPHLKMKDNSSTLADIESLNERERKTWLKFNEPLFYQAQAWLEWESDKVFLYDHLAALFSPKAEAGSTFSKDCTLYFAHDGWRLHLTSKHWVYSSLKKPHELSIPNHLSLRLGFFSDSLAPLHSVEDLFHQHSALKGDHVVITSLHQDAFDDFPETSKGIPLDRAQDEWRKTWKDIRALRRSCQDTNQGEIYLKDLGVLLDLGFSSDPLENARYRRGYPSAGGFYAECLMIEINRVEGINPGIYLYHPRNHSLYLIDEKTHSEHAISFLIASRIDLLRKKYLRISTRLMLLNSGVMMHQLSLVTGMIGLKGYPKGSHQQYPWKEVLQKFWPVPWQISGRYTIT